MRAGGSAAGATPASGIRIRFQDMRHTHATLPGRPGCPLFERALAIRERVLGPDHPDTVATRRALEELAAERGGNG